MCLLFKIECTLDHVNSDPYWTRHDMISHCCIAAYPWLVITAGSFTTLTFAFGLPVLFLHIVSLHAGLSGVLQAYSMHPWSSILFSAM